MITLYARREPSRWHRARYDTLLYWDREGLSLQARYPYHAPRKPREGDTTHWINNYGHPELVGLEWLARKPLKHN